MLLGMRPLRDHGTGLISTDESRSGIEMQEVGALRDSIVLESVPSGMVLSIAVIPGRRLTSCSAEPHQAGSAAPWPTKWVSWQGWGQHLQLPAC
jgi:hypothetical protein